MDFSGPIVELMKLISPDGKSFDAKKFQEVAATFKQEDEKLRSQLEAPTTSPAERQAQAVSAALAFEPLQARSGQRTVDAMGQLRNQQDTSYQRKLQDFTNAQLQTLQPGYDSISEGRQMQSADYGKLLEYQGGQRDADRELRRELMNKRNTMGLIKTGIGGGLLLLEMLRD